MSLSLLLQLRIQRIAQAVAHQVKRQYLSLIHILVWVNLGSLGVPQLSLQQGAATVDTSVSSQSTPDNTSISTASAAEIPAQSAAPNNSNLNDWLDRFYASEQQRQTHFPAALPADAQPFDLLIINICSLSWSDLSAVGLQDHPLWKRMDILFNNFNSATAYSGPASIRLLRASCGQPSHKACLLYTSRCV